MKNFRALQLAIAFYHSVVGLKLPHHLKDQLLRTSSSVALNLAEGRGKPTPRDQRRYYDIAMGSLRESQTVLLLTTDVEPSLKRQADHLGASLFLLIRNSRK